MRDRSLYVAPIRLGLGVLWLVLARVAGAPSAGSLLAFAGGLFVIVFFLANDPRARFLRSKEPEAYPDDAVVASRLRQALHATIPSTIGVSVLAAVALVPKPILAALLGGISAGLGVAGLFYALRSDGRLYVEPLSGTVYRR